jgi:flagellar export protein FliJ
MKPFSFSLEPVLHYRREVERRKQRILGQALKQLAHAEDDLAALREKFEHYADVLRTTYRTLQFQHLHKHYAQMEEVNRRISSSDGAICRCRITVENARMELMRASTERRIIETLKATRLAQHRAREAAAEQNDLDEANMVAYAVERGCFTDGQIGLPTCFSFYAHGGG